MSFTREGNRFGVTCDGDAKVYDRRSPYDQVHGLSVDDLRTAAFDARGRLWSVSEDGVSRTLGAPPAAGTVRWTNPTGDVTRLRSMTTLAVGKTWAAVGGLDGTVRVFAAGDDVPTLTPAAALELRGYVVALPAGTVRASWPAHRAGVTAAAFLSPTLFATGGRDRVVRFWAWDGARVKELWGVRTGAAVTSLGPSADGHRLTVTCQGDRGVHLWDVAALARRFADLGLGIDAPPGWSVTRLPVPEPLLTPREPAPRTGLRAEYLADRELRTLRVVRHDPQPYCIWAGR